MDRTKNSKLNNLFSEFLNDITLFRDIENDFDDSPEEEKEKWQSLRDDLLKLAEKAENFLEEIVLARNRHEPLRLGVVGDFSAGKSTFINSLLQKEICPMAVAPKTAAVTEFVYGDREKYARKIKTDEGTYDWMEIDGSEYMEQAAAEPASPSVSNFRCEFPWNDLRDIVIYDTPGFEDIRERGNDEVTMEVLGNMDVLFWVMDANVGGVSRSMLEKLDLLKNASLKNNRKILHYLIVNKADTKSPQVLESIVNEAKKLPYFEEGLPYSSTSWLQPPEETRVLEDIEKKIEESPDREWTLTIHQSIKKQIHSRKSKVYIRLKDIRSSELPIEQPHWSRQFWKRVITLVDGSSNTEDVHVPSSEPKWYKRESYAGVPRKKVVGLLNDIIGRKTDILLDRIQWAKEECEGAYDEMKKNVLVRIASLLEERDSSEPLDSGWQKAKLDIKQGLKSAKRNTINDLVEKICVFEIERKGSFWEMFWGEYCHITFQTPPDMRRKIDTAAKKIINIIRKRCRSLSIWDNKLDDSLSSVFERIKKETKSDFENISVHLPESGYSPDKAREKILEIKRNIKERIGDSIDKELNDFFSSTDTHVAGGQNRQNISSNKKRNRILDKIEKTISGSNACDSSSNS